LTFAICLLICPFRRQKRLAIGEKSPVAGAAREKLDGAAHLALVGLKTQRQLAVTRGKRGLNFRGRGRNLMVRENILYGLYLRKKTKPSDGKK
jgi:hypothetical protein